MCVFFKEEHFCYSFSFGQSDKVFILFKCTVSYLLWAIDANSMNVTSAESLQTKCTEISHLTLGQVSFLI